MEISPIVYDQMLKQTKRNIIIISFHHIIPVSSAEKLDLYFAFINQITNRYTYINFFWILF